MNWQETGADPNATGQRENRLETLRKIRAEDYLLDRSNYLCALASGKSVLDCGIVEHTLEASYGDDWLHRKIVESARSCLGVDILESEVTVLRELGFNVKALDVTKEALPQTFELIVAGEIIEHIDNLGHAFANWRKMLVTGGRLVITTPNPWYLNCMLKNILIKSTLSESVDHVGWHEPATLYELGSRYGLRLSRYTGLFVANTNSRKAAVFFKLARVLARHGIKYEIFSKSLLYEFTVD